MHRILLLVLGFSTYQLVGATAEEIILQYFDSGCRPTLSTDTNRPIASSRFRFRVNLIIADREDSKSASIEGEAREDVALIVTTTNGLPFAYMTTGLWVGFLNRAEPGVLIRSTNGHPEFVFAASTNEAGLVFSFSFAPIPVTPEAPMLLLNFARVFDPAFSLVAPSYDNQTHELLFISKRRGTKVVMNLDLDRDKLFGIERVRIIKDARILDFFDFKVNPASDHLPILSLRDFEMAKVPVKVFKSDKVLATSVAPDFPKDAKERLAAEQFGKFLSSRRR